MGHGLHFPGSPVGVAVLEDWWRGVSDLSGAAAEGSGLQNCVGTGRAVVLGACPSGWPTGPAGCGWEERLAFCEKLPRKAKSLLQTPRRLGTHPPRAETGGSGLGHLFPSEVSEGRMGATSTAPPPISSPGFLPPFWKEALTTSWEILALSLWEVSDGSTLERLLGGRFPPSPWPGQCYPLGTLSSR